MKMGKIKIKDQQWLSWIRTTSTEAVRVLKVKLFRKTGNNVFLAKGWQASHLEYPTLYQGHFTIHSCYTFSHSFLSITTGNPRFTNIIISKSLGPAHFVGLMLPLSTALDHMC